MAVHVQPSLASLSQSRYAPTRSLDEDVFNGSTSRDFCNSFWGAGDAGPNVLFTRMRGAAKTTDEIRNFWNERSIIEEEYAARLAKLAKVSIGNDEIGDLRNSLDNLRVETEKQAECHRILAEQIRTELEVPTSEFHMKQVKHRRTIQASVEKKFKVKQTQEAYVRINAYSQQSQYMQGKDLERITMKLQRARQTVQANERDLANFQKVLLDLLPDWEADWKEFCDSCQDLEEERIDHLKDIMWAYANAVSTVCVKDDESCEAIRSSLDLLEAERDVENFVNEHGTGNIITEPVLFIPEKGTQSSPGMRPAEFVRVSRRPPPVHPESVFSESANRQQARAEELNAIAQTAVNGDSARHSPHPTTNELSHQNGVSRNGSYEAQATAPRAEVPNHSPVVQRAPSMSRAPPVRRRTTIRRSQPLPVPQQGARVGGERAPTPPPLPDQNGRRILFYVTALYDYTATTPEEFDFQQGDVIAVTETPDDGWWSGELLDEARREEGRNIFPSNFVCLF
ncbi:SH3 domain-containing protein [Cyathus striatus]|nr:SH3 domain-containing protein [Cyathus striatus]